MGSFGSDSTHPLGSVESDLVRDPIVSNIGNNNDNVIVPEESQKESDDWSVRIPSMRGT